MADVERIAPPVPTLPPPIGRNVGTNKRRAPERDSVPERRERDGPARRAPESDSEHIDEYA